MFKYKDNLDNWIQLVELNKNSKIDEKYLLPTIVVSATSPSDTTKLWRSTVDNQLRFYNGTEWAKAGGGIEYAATIKDWRVD